MGPESEALWYYKVAGEERGPISTAELITLVKRRKLFPDDSIRLNGGEWIFAGTVEEVFDSIADTRAAPTLKQRSQVASERKCQAATGDASNAAANLLHRRHLRQFGSQQTEPPGLIERMIALCSRVTDPVRNGWEYFAEKLAIFREAVLESRIVLAIVCVLFLAVIVRSLPLKWRSEADPYLTYVTLWNEQKELRRANAGEAQWNEFTTRASQEVSNVTKRLEKNANSKDRVTLLLLWAGRDQFPKMLFDARVGISESERQFSNMLSEARWLTEQKEAQGSSMDLVTVIIVTIDICIVAGVVVFILTRWEAA